MVEILRVQAVQVEVVEHLVEQSDGLEDEKNPASFPPGRNCPKTGKEHWGSVVVSGSK